MILDLLIRLFGLACILCGMLAVERAENNFWICVGTVSVFGGVYLLLA